MGGQLLEGLGWGWSGFLLKKYCSPKSAPNLGKVKREFEGPAVGDEKRIRPVEAN